MRKWKQPCKKLAYLCDGLTGLKTAIIGDGITSIGEKAFMNCSLLENIVALRERPKFINSNVFDGVPKANCDLHVRHGCNNTTFFETFV